jgi:hypothetical protein
MTVQISKRRQETEARRRKIMTSQRFHDWWAARRGIHPVPADPYRAYMIDKSLHAKIHRKEVWQYRTNRADYPPVDLPTWVPAPKRRMPTRKEERRFATVPRAAVPFEATEFEKGLGKLGEEMAEHYHVPRVKVYYERGEGVLESAYFHGLAGIMEPYVKIGTKGQAGLGVQKQIFSGLTHEVGHHVHAKFGLEPSLAAAGKMSLEFATAPKIAREQKAWEFADPFMRQGRPIQKWLKKYALGTYLGTSPRRQVLQIRGIGLKKRR